MALPLSSAVKAPPCSVHVTRSSQDTKRPHHKSRLVVDSVVIAFVLELLQKPTERGSQGGRETCSSWKVTGWMQSTGQLELKSGKGGREIFVLKGNLSIASSTAEAESLPVCQFACVDQVVKHPSCRNTLALPWLQAFIHKF